MLEKNADLEKLTQEERGMFIYYQFSRENVFFLKKIRKKSKKQKNQMIWFEFFLLDYLLLKFFYVKIENYKIQSEITIKIPQDLQQILMEDFENISNNKVIN